MARWEGPITPTHSEATVTTASGAALAANHSRRYALMINDSDTDIYIRLGETAVANEGIRINAGGGSYSISPVHGNMFLGAINAIHGGTGNKVLLVLEGI